MKDQLAKEQKESKREEKQRVGGREVRAEKSTIN